MGAVPAVKPSKSDGSAGDDLETKIKKAKRTAELEARGRHGAACISLRCERDIERSLKEAEKRVRREEAQKSN